MIICAESWFKSLKTRDYRTTWGLLTAESKERILTDIIEKAKDKSAIDKETLRKDFDECGSVCKAYWDTFVLGFDPDIALEESSWQIGRIKGKKGEIVLKHKTSKRPAILKMFKEDGSWKFGLVESFWKRKGK